MNPILQQYLSSVEEREKKASAGPWIYEEDDEGSTMGWVTRANLPLFAVLGDSAQQAENADFIAHSRTDIPLQTAIIRKLAEALEGAWTMLDAANRRRTVEAQRDHLDAEIESLITQAIKP